MENDWRIGAIRRYLDLLKVDPRSTVSVIELWDTAPGEPEAVWYTMPARNRNDA